MTWAQFAPILWTMLHTACVVVQGHASQPPTLGEAHVVYGGNCWQAILSAPFYPDSWVSVVAS